MSKSAKFIIYLSVSITLILRQSTDAGNHNGPCSTAASQSSPACLDFITTQLSDNKLWWFGSDYRQVCSQAPKNTREPACFNQNPSFRSLGARLFEDGGFSVPKYLKNLKGVLPLTYTSAPDTIRACNTTKQEGRSIVTPYPGSAPMPAFAARAPPKFPPIPGCTSQSLCTIVLNDPGNMFIHNVWVNYPDNQNFSDYLGPAGFNVNPNPYVWTVFKQKNGPIVKKDSDMEHVVLKDFMAKYGLEGPIYYNIMEVQAGMYAFGQGETFGYHQNCPLLLENKMRDESHQAVAELGLNVPLAPLKTWIPVEIAGYSKSKTRFNRRWLDPIGNPCIPFEDIVHESSIIIQPRVVGPNSMDLENEFYSVALVEGSPKMAGPKVDTKGKVDLLWLRDSVLGKNVALGRTVVPFSGISRKANVKPQNFYILLLSQPKRELGQLQNWLTQQKCDKFGTTPGRCIISLAQLMRSQKLSLDGMSRFKLC